MDNKWIVSCTLDSMCAMREVLKIHLSCTAASCTTLWLYLYIKALSLSCIGNRNSATAPGCFTHRFARQVFRLHSCSKITNQSLQLRSSLPQLYRQPFTGFQSSDRKETDRIQTPKKIKETHRNLRPSFMSMLEAGWPKNSMRFILVTGAPQLSCAATSPWIHNHFTALPSASLTI